MKEFIERASNFLPRVDDRVNRPTGRHQALVALNSPASVAAEQFRVLYYRLERLRAEHGMKLVTLTSAVAGEGKSLTAANLALVAAAAEPNRKVLLIDADLRRPCIGSLLNVVGRPGLGELLSDDAAGEGVIRRVAGSRLMVVPAGAPREEAGQLIATKAMRDFLNQARAHFDEIYLDAPPLLPVADGALLAGMSDAAVLVVRAGSTGRGLVWQAVEALAGVRLLGCVLNGVDTSELAYLSPGKSRAK
jgi:capsular exopolysaccharide synthesis family protein